jgi:tRNA threonylcarbamoyladenosine biosynthesis protein TsaB
LAYSASLQDKNDVSVAIDARMSEVYFARYRINELGLPEEVAPEQVIAPMRLQKETENSTCLIGNGWTAGYELPEAITKQLDSVLEQGLPNALHSAELAAKLIENKLAKPVAPELAIPVYLRDDVTWDNKPKIGS